MTNPVQQVTEPSATWLLLDRASPPSSPPMDLVHYLEDCKNRYPPESSDLLGLLLQISLGCSVPRELEDETTAWTSQPVALDLDVWRKEVAGAEFMRLCSRWKTFGDVAVSLRDIFEQLVGACHDAVDELSQLSGVGEDTAVAPVRSLSDSQLLTFLRSEGELHFVLAQIAAELRFIEHWFSHVREHRRKNQGIIESVVGDKHWSHQSFRCLAINALAVEYDYRAHCKSPCVKEWRSTYARLYNRGSTRDSDSKAVTRPRLPSELYACKKLAALKGIRSERDGIATLPSPMPKPPPVAPLQGDVDTEAQPVAEDNRNASSLVSYRSLSVWLRDGSFWEWMERNIGLDSGDAPSPPENSRVEQLMSRSDVAAIVVQLVQKSGEAATLCGVVVPKIESEAHLWYTKMHSNAKTLAKTQKMQLAKHLGEVQQLAARLSALT